MQTFMYFLYYKMIDSNLLFKLFDLIKLLALSQRLQLAWNSTAVECSAGLSLHKLMNNPQCINFSQLSKKFSCSEKAFYECRAANQAHVIPHWATSNNNFWTIASRKIKSSSFIYWKVFFLPRHFTATWTAPRWKTTASFHRLWLATSEFSQQTSNSGRLCALNWWAAISTVRFTNRQRVNGVLWYKYSSLPVLDFLFLQ